MRILVTGGAGFIGSAVVRLFVGGGTHDVCNVDKLTYAGNVLNVAEVESAPGYELVVADIADRDRMRGLFSAFAPQAVINLAAESHVDRSIDDPGVVLQSNIMGAGVLLQEALRFWQALPVAAQDQFRFLQISTDEVYGELGAEGFFTETSAYSPNSPYAASKAGADHLARAFHRTYGLPVIVTNCSNNYGPYQFPEKLIPLAILNALEGKEIPVYGQGENIRDWIYVDDHVAALQHVLNSGRPGATYLIGARAEMRNIDLVRQVCRILDDVEPALAHRPHDALIRFVTDRPGHDSRYAIDPSRIETDLGWQPVETLDTGLQKTIAWYLENQIWCEQTRMRYDRARLGLGTEGQGGQA